VTRKELGITVQMKVSFIFNLKTTPFRVSIEFLRKI
jgi:hypothetical protein